MPFSIRTMLKVLIENNINFFILDFMAHISNSMEPSFYRESLPYRHYLKRQISASRNDKNNLKKAS